MRDYFTDTFDRADQNLDASADWTTAVGVSTGLRIVGNELECNGGGAGQYAYYTDEFSSQNTYAQLTITGVQASTQIGPCVRMDDASGDGDGYMMMVDGYASNIARLRRTDGTTRTTLASTGTAVSNGQKLRVTAEGSSLTGELLTAEGTALETLTAVDSIYGTTTHNHVGVFGFSGGTNPTADDFIGGLVVGPNILTDELGDVLLTEDWFYIEADEQPEQTSTMLVLVPTLPLATIPQPGQIARFIAFEPLTAISALTTIAVGPMGLSLEPLGATLPTPQSVSTGATITLPPFTVSTPVITMTTSGQATVTLIPLTPELPVPKLPKGGFVQYAAWQGSAAGRARLSLRRRRRRRR